MPSLFPFVPSVSSGWHRRAVLILPAAVLAAGLLAGMPRPAAAAPLCQATPVSECFKRIEKHFGVTITANIRLDAATHLDAPPTTAAAAVSEALKPVTGYASSVMANGKAITVTLLPTADSQTAPGVGEAAGPAAAKPAKTGPDLEKLYNTPPRTHAAEASPDDKVIIPSLSGENGLTNRQLRSNQAKAEAAQPDPDKPFVPNVSKETSPTPNQMRQSLQNYEQAKKTAPPFTLPDGVTRPAVPAQKP